MPGYVKRTSFLESADGVAMRQELLRMIESPLYNTGAATDSKTSFIEKHQNYIIRFPYIDPRQYILNLKMKSRI